jgi:predicted nucleic acid-binding protein
MTSGSIAFLVDTNIPVYAVDPRDLLKQQRALNVLDHLDLAGTGVVGVQTLHEFMSVSTRRLVPVLPPEDAASIVRYFLRRWRILSLTPDVTHDALLGVIRYQLSWWDALVWATAEVHGIPVVLSEDFHPGAMLGRVRFANPFDSAFNFTSL